MKPFDLEAAKRGEPVQTRDGRPVVFGAYNPGAKEYECVIGWVDGYVNTWAFTGASIAYQRTPFDLFMAPKKHREERWHNWYITDGEVLVGWAFLTKALADENASVDRVACTKTVVAWEE